MKSFSYVWVVNNSRPSGTYHRMGRILYYEDTSPFCHMPLGCGKIMIETLKEEILRMALRMTMYYVCASLHCTSHHATL